MRNRGRISIVLILLALALLVTSGAALAKGEPVQYVLGEWDFRRLTLKCDRRALIPRPETEGLVTLVLAHLSRSPAPTARPSFIVDVGTGTGAIILSLAQEFRGSAAFLGTDVSEDAIALAQENAAKCALAGKVKFAVADGLDDFDEPECIDVIVSNPPYIESAVCDALDPRVRDYEPRLALDGGEDGLDYYRIIAENANKHLARGGILIMEVGEGQAQAVAGLFKYCDYAMIIKDGYGVDRFVKIVI
jgi:release factor glutamine methyltransferase